MSPEIEILVSRHGTGMGLRFLSFLGLCALILAESRSARAEPGAPASSYDAPTGCESAEAFRARVRADVSTPPPYHVRIAAHDDRFEGTVLLAGAAHPSRTIEAETCDDVVKALALAVSLSAVSAVETPPTPPLLPTTVGPRTAEDQPPLLAPRRRDLLVSFGMSLFADSELQVGLAVDTKIVYRNELFAAGALVELGAALTDYKYVGLAPMAGIFAPGPTWLRAGLLGAIGLHSYWDADGVRWFGGCPCGAGSLPFTGVRALLGVDVWYIHVGIHGFADADIGRIQGAILDTNRTTSSPFNIGTTRFGGGLAIGPRVSL